MDLHDDRPFTLQLVALDGEAVAVTAAPTSTGRQLRQQLLAQLGPRPGRRIGWMQRGEDEVELTKTLKEQGIGADELVSYVYVPASVHDGWKLIQGFRVEDYETALEGITELKGIDNLLYLRTLPCSLQSMTFGNPFDQVLLAVSWPSQLEHLKFSYHFDQRLERTVWPSRLKTLIFGSKFNQPLQRVKWPESLERLTFGDNFNQSFEGVTLPPKLQSLTLGGDFNKSLVGVDLPSSLQTLTFGWHFDQGLREVTLPHGLQSLAFGNNFNQSLQGVLWPDSLVSVTFGNKFDQSLEGITWPSGLQSLTFASQFNQRLEGVTFPSNLKELIFGSEFNQNLHVSLPTSLQNLTFGDKFHQSMDPLTWLSNLKNLTFGHGFNEELQQILLPSQLQTLRFGNDFNQSLKGILGTLEQLQSVTFGNSFNQSLEDVKFPPSLQVLIFGSDFNQTLLGVAWPQSLKRLTFGVHYNQTLEGVALPETLETLTFGVEFNRSLDAVDLPKSLQTLTLGWHFDQSLQDVILPSGLQSLSFVCSRIHNLRDLTLPSGLQILKFGFWFNQSLEGLVFPCNLKTLIFGREFNQSLDHVTLPNSLQTLTFGDKFNQNLDEVTWPIDLETLTFGCHFQQSLEKVTFPSNLESLTFGHEMRRRLVMAKLPSRLEMLTVGRSLTSTRGVVPDGTLLVTKGTVDPFNAKVVRCSMGAAVRGAVHVREVAQPELASLLAEHRVFVTELRDRGTGEDALPSWSLGGTFDRSRCLRVAWPSLEVAGKGMRFGNEARGVSPEVAQLAQRTLGVSTGRLCIPMSPSVDSLNVGISVGIVLHEAARPNAHSVSAASDGSAGKKQASARCLVKACAGYRTRGGPFRLKTPQSEANAGGEAGFFGLFGLVRPVRRISTSLASRRRLFSKVTEMDRIKAEARTPSILSCSRRTDVPWAFLRQYLKAFREGFLYVRSPVTGDMDPVCLKPYDASTGRGVMCISWWSKNYCKWIEEFKKQDSILHSYPVHMFNFTVNSDDKVLEPGVFPPLQERLGQVTWLASTFGAHALNVRFDPIVHYRMKGQTAVRNNLGDFEEIVKHLGLLGLGAQWESTVCGCERRTLRRALGASGVRERFSQAAAHTDVGAVRNMLSAGVELVALSEEQQRAVLDQLLPLAHRYAVEMRCCCDDTLFGHRTPVEAKVEVRKVRRWGVGKDRSPRRMGVRRREMGELRQAIVRKKDFLCVKESRCLDARLADRLAKEKGLSITFPHQKDRGQREMCNCTASREIGQYELLGNQRPWGWPWGSTWSPWRAEKAINTMKYVLTRTFPVTVLDIPGPRCTLAKATCFCHIPEVTYLEAPVPQNFRPMTPVLRSPVWDHYQARG
ncbi:unnamed protein product [Durusdinium trenchii]|uniref:tRNA/rRNA methyltransferase SpoU type domain-containing protein n=2 Tax=Durusdinium trenchii TaxID=1381693 RepID=A0ABP0JZ02_9DINO